MRFGGDRPKPYQRDDDAKSATFEVLEIPR